MYLSCENNFVIAMFCYSDRKVRKKIYNHKAQRHEKWGVAFPF